MGRNGNAGTSILIQRKTFSLSQWWSTGTGSPEIWSRLLFWGYSKPTWLLSYVTYCREPSSAGDWTTGSPKLPSNPCNSMTLWYQHEKMNNIVIKKMPLKVEDCISQTYFLLKTEKNIYNDPTVAVEYVCGVCMLSLFTFSLRNAFYIILNLL